jgi:pyridoxal 5'-phosphate synthase pdxT subunit
VEVGILALQGDFQEHVRALSEIGARPKLIRRPGDLPGISGLVLPGGESTTLGMLLDSSELREPVGKLLASGLPVFGTCAGMILLARTVIDGRSDQQTFGTLDVDVRRNGFGRQRQSFECDLDVTGLDEKLPAVFIRAPMVERVGPEVVVLSEIEAGSTGHLIPSGSATTPVLVRQEQVLAAAFHPELTPDRRLHRIFLEMIEKEGR